METNYLEAIRTGDIQLLDVPKKSKTHALCLAAVNRNGLDLYHVPKYLRTETIQYAAVFQNAEAIKLVDADSLKSNPDLLVIAAGRKGHLLTWMVKTVPEVITYDLCLKAVRSAGCALSFVPEHYLDKRMIRAAVEADAAALNFVFTHHSDDVKAAIADVIEDIPLKHLPDHFKTYDVCLAQVSQQGRQLRYVPFPLIDKKMVGAALASNKWAVEYVPVTFSDLDTVISVMNDTALPSHLFDHIAAGVEIVYD